MIGKLSYSIELNNRIGGRVKFGDDVFVEIHGKGFILFKGEQGSQKLLADIYYISSLTTNITSLGQATKNSCHMSMKGDPRLLYDT